MQKMKKVFTMAFGALLVASCGQSSNGYTLSGTIKGEPANGTQIFLRTTDSLNQLVSVDTTTVENGSFVFSGAQQAEPKLHFVFMESNQGNVPVVIENGNIEMTFQKDSMNFAKIKGTVQNELFMGFLEESRKLSERAMSMQMDMRDAAQKMDTATVASIREEFQEFQEEAKNFNIDFIKQNPNALISVIILGNVMASQALPLEEVKALFEALTPEIKDTEPGRKLKAQLDSMKSTELGAKAPEFSAPTPQGDLLALSDVTGNSKLTLVDFWAAWCGPCRRENPNIVSVYHQFKDKGFTVLGVSLDTRAEDWKKAIEADGLEWNHISNLQRFNDPIAQLYSINAIPAAFLLDENGIIVAKDLRGPALGAKVAELLN